MTTLRPTFWIVLLLCLPLAPVFAAPPIRCVHQTTVVKNGKATTHLIMTTARPGEAQTTKNTADVVYPGIIGIHLYNDVLEADKIFSNADGSIVAVNFTRSQPKYYQTYLFLSSKHGIIVLHDFTARVAQLLEDNWQIALQTQTGWQSFLSGTQSQKRAAWRHIVRHSFQHELYADEIIERNSIGITARSNDFSDLDFSITVSPTGQLHLEEIEASYE